MKIDDEIVICVSATDNVKMLGEKVAAWQSHDSDLPFLSASPTNARK